MVFIIIIDFVGGIDFVVGVVTLVAVVDDDYVVRRLSTKLLDRLPSPVSLAI
jgi:hypothetical protein